MFSVGQYGQLDVLQMILDEFECMRNGYYLHCVLMGACAYRKYEIVTLLKKILDSQGSLLSWNEALYDTCCIGDIQMTKLLIKNGANNFEEGLCYAAKHGHCAIVDLMIERGAKNIWQAMHYAFVTKNLNVMKTLYNNNKLYFKQHKIPEDYLIKFNGEFIVLMLEQGIHEDFIETCGLAINDKIISDVRQFRSVILLQARFLLPAELLSIVSSYSLF